LDSTKEDCIALKLNAVCTYIESTVVVTSQVVIVVGDLSKPLHCADANCSFTLSCFHYCI